MEWQRPKVNPGSGLNTIQCSYHQIGVKLHVGAYGVKLFSVDAVSMNVIT